MTTNPCQAREFGEYRYLNAVAQAQAIRLFSAGFAGALVPMLQSSYTPYLTVNLLKVHARFRQITKSYSLLL